MAPDKIITSVRRSLTKRICAFSEDESGATSIEYGLLVSLIFLAIVAAVRAFTVSTSEMYGTLDAAIQN